MSDLVPLPDQRHGYFSYHRCNCYTAYTSGNCENFSIQGREEKLPKEIVRYSENYLRSCINDALYKDVNKPDLMDYGIGSIILKNVVNTDKTTEVTATAYGSETYLPESGKPYIKKTKTTLVLQRARYPERRKTDGAFFKEKDCPSCGANFIPDEHNCCSFCGYSFQVDNAKWVIKATGES